MIGGKVLAVSNEQFTIRELGDNAVEEGNVRVSDKGPAKKWRQVIVVLKVRMSPKKDMAS